jgi:hypothetical protein
MMMATIMALMAADAATPLAPSGKWVVDYQEQRCALSRAFGTGDDQATLMFQPGLNGPTMKIVLVTPGGPGGHSEGKGSIALQPSGETVETDFAAGDGKGKVRVTTMKVDRAKLAALGAAKTVTITAGQRAVTLAPTATSAALVAIDKCNDNLLAGWGVTPADRAPVAVEPDLILTPDLFATVQSIAKDGTVIARVRVGVDGRGHDCAVVAKSGDPAMDRTVCEALSGRARYHPAKQADGTPVTSLLITSYVHKTEMTSGKQR